MRTVAQNPIQTKFQMWNCNPSEWKPWSPLASGNWQLYLGLQGHIQWDTNQEKELGRNMMENAKNICRELGFLCYWYNRVLLVIITMAQSHAYNYI